jgi:hypothetical protein
MDNEHRSGRMTVSDLENAVAQLPEDAERGLRTVVRCYSVIKHFFGDEWLGKNIVFAGPKTYLGFDFSSDIAREEKTWRLGEISEMLFNLQHYDGFASCIEQMEHGDIESVYAELEIAKWLHVYDVRFCFNRRRFIKQSDYDLEIVYPEAIACADTKCKVETTEINAGSIADSIRQARTQLPPNRPGIVFIKVPEPWLRSREMTAEIFRVARNKISGTGRIVSVKFYPKSGSWVIATMARIGAFGGDEHNCFDAFASPGG